MAFCYKLRARALLSPAAVARATTAARQSRVLLLRTVGPKPLTSFDVGVGSDGSLLYRSARGTVSSIHPAIQPADGVPMGSTLLPDGTCGVALQPPPDSPFEPCPDASGAICYVDRDSGGAQWDAPPGSASLQARPLLERSFSLPPPSLPPGLGYATLHGTHWHPLYSDRLGRVCLYHAETGAVREAPWVCLRNQPYGSVFFANLITQESRWFPPHRWMESWISRPTYLDSNCCYRNTGDNRDLCERAFAGHRLEQQLLPLAIARQRVECGAPPSLYERGVPQYLPDPDDTWDSHPLCVEGGPPLGGWNVRASSASSHLVCTSCVYGPTGQPTLMGG
jgi:hypothetical protein